MAKTKKSGKPAPKPAKSATAKPKAAKPVAKPTPKSKPAAKPAKAPAAKTTSKKASPAPKAPKPAKPDAKPDAKSKKPAKAAPAPAAKPVESPDGKKSPKGITIVNPKQVKKTKPKIKLEMPRSEPLIKPGTKWKPLIPSGPKAPPSPYGVWRSPDAPGLEEFKIDPKAKLPKKELERYRDILLRKRAELLGDITGMENEALRASSGSLSSLPQHMAEQGSDTYDQHLSLDLAAVDRTLIREIDDALQRIDDGTFGVCMKTGKRIGADRLEEIPWARYSIEAAREMERNPYPGTSSAAEDHSSSADID